MASLKYVMYCHECGEETISKEMVQICPKCGSDRMQTFREVTCSCGGTMLLTQFTNTCACGKMYNNFGQELAPVSEWDPDDVCDIFGPQN